MCPKRGEFQDTCATKGKSEIQKFVSEREVATFVHFQGKIFVRQLFFSFEEYLIPVHTGCIFKPSLMEPLH